LKACIAKSMLSTSLLARPAFYDLMRPANLTRS